MGRKNRPPLSELTACHFRQGLNFTSLYAVKDSEEVRPGHCPGPLICVPPNSKIQNSSCYSKRWGTSRRIGGYYWPKRCVFTATTFSPTAGRRRCTSPMRRCSSITPKESYTVRTCSAG